MPVQADLYLDPDTGDLQEITRLTTSLELIQQRIRRRLRRGTGEWFLDPDGTGLPLIDWAQSKPPNVPLIVSRVQEEIRAVPGVVATANFEGEHDMPSRRLTVRGDVIADDGAVTSVVVLGTPDQAHNTMWFGIYFASGNIRGGIPRPSTGSP